MYCRKKEKYYAFDNYAHLKILKSKSQRIKIVSTKYEYQTAPNKLKRNYNLKHCDRKKMMQIHLKVKDVKEFDLWKCIYILRNSWKVIYTSTNSNCYEKWGSINQN